MQAAYLLRTYRYKWQQNYIYLYSYLYTLISAYIFLLKKQVWLFDNIYGGVTVNMVVAQLIEITDV